MISSDPIVLHAGNLGGIEILEYADRKYDPNTGDPSRKDWYNKRSGYLYISHFKTEKSAMGQSYEFQLLHEMRDTIDVTLAPGAPEAKRKYLVNIEAGGPTTKEKPGLSLPTGDKI